MRLWQLQLYGAEHSVLSGEHGKVASVHFKALRDIREVCASQPPK